MFVIIHVDVDCCTVADLTGDSLIGSMGMESGGGDGGGASQLRVQPAQLAFDLKEVGGAAVTFHPWPECCPPFDKSYGVISISCVFR